MVDVWLFTVDCFSSPCLFPACSLVPCYYIHLVCVKLKQLLVLGSILFSSQPNTNLHFPFLTSCIFRPYPLRMAMLTTIQGLGLQGNTSGGCTYLASGCGFFSSPWISPPVAKFFFWKKHHRTFSQTLKNRTVDAWNAFETASSWMQRCMMFEEEYVSAK